MNDQIECQIDTTMRKFSKIKNEYLELKSANNNLKEAIDLLRKRLLKKEEQRYDLITMFKKITSQNQVKIESLQKENNHLQITVQEQNQTIEEHSNMIDELKKKLELATKQNVNDDQNNNDEQINIASSTSTIIQNENDKLDHSRDESNDFNTTNLNNFAHPSFNNVPTVTKKGQKKIRGFSHFRWPNLDIMVSGGKNIDKNVIQTNTTTDNDSKFLYKFEKRRRLYCPDDATVDLEN